MTPRLGIHLIACCFALGLAGCDGEAERVGGAPTSAKGTASVAAASGKRRVNVDLPSLPLRGATEEERTRFKEGDALFEAVVRESDGLGPLYIRDACAACHAADGRGPGLVTKVVLSDADRGRASELLPFGPTERPYAVAGASQPLLAPRHDGVTTTVRQPPAVFGRGYLEAVAEAELLRLEAEAGRRTGSIRGRLHRHKNGKIGRFGVKARIANLRDFTVDALNGDMGITTAEMPAEAPGPEGLQDDKKPGVDFSAEQVTRITDYIRLLEIPDRRPEAPRGAALFAQVGCATCHVPSLRTEARFMVPALSDIDAPVYTDLLLHDMGRAFSDGQIEGDAGPSEFRTPPLIGLRFLPTLLHDGRARTVEQAIFAHGEPDSEARDAVALFRALADAERQELVNFVEAL
jgi:CxxC motif-containing protein (DUF1111 family)